MHLLYILLLVLDRQGDPWALSQLSSCKLIHSKLMWLSLLHTALCHTDKERKQTRTMGLVLSFPPLKSMYLMNRKSKQKLLLKTFTEEMIHSLVKKYILTPQQKHVAIALIDTEAIKA